MSGLICLLSDTELQGINFERLVETIDLGKTYLTEELKGDNEYFAVSHLSHAPVGGRRLIEYDEWIVTFAGDMIDHVRVPLEEIVGYLDEGNFAGFSAYDGIYAIVAFDKTRKVLYLITDRRAQMPLYIYREDNRFWFFTEMATGCRVSENVGFNQQWLWQYMFFNVPVGSLTFLNNVERIGAGCVLELNWRSKSFRKNTYSSQFSKSPELLEKPASFDLAERVMKDRVKKYFDSERETACALSAGWDGRTILALGPREHVTAYTYGVHGCDDVEVAKLIAKRLGLRHKVILFGDDFIGDLERRMFETVYLSSGMQGVLRSTLTYVYSKLTERGKRFPVTLSGIDIDGLFRGHSAVPDLVSYDLGNIFLTGKPSIRRKFWSNVFEGEYENFEKEILSCLDGLQERFGEYGDAEHVLSYNLYCFDPNYFQGEVEIANCYTTLRVPAFDQEIINLAYSIKESSLTFSQFSGHKRGSLDEMLLQAFVLKRSAPEFAQMTVGGNTRPDVVLKGKSAYQIYRIYKGILRRIGMRTLFPARKMIPLEDWAKWLRNKEAFVKEMILSDNARLKKYFGKDFIDKTVKCCETYYLGKLLTVEIILRLIENRWQKFW